MPTPTNPWSPGDHPDARVQQQDLAKARQAATFDPRDITHILYDGVDGVATRNRLRQLIEQDPVFRKSDWYFLSRTERIERALAWSKRFIEIKQEHGIDQRELLLMMNALGDWLPTTLHSSMFQLLIDSQGSEEQAARWGPLADEGRMIGCYAQTELGHGSNLARLETRATYVPETDEWDLHSPSLSSAKWWIGGLGVIATHALVQAKLWIHGKDYGPHLFMVPLRCRATHQALPGVRVGDIGPKLGFSSVDNGYVLFHHHRIPRTNLLMRHAQVDDKGVYHPPLHAKLSFGGMVLVRTQIAAFGAATALSYATTIATRYSAQRRQGYRLDKTNSPMPPPSVPENVVLDYQAVRYRLFPLIAASFVIHGCGRQMFTLFMNMQSELAAGNTAPLSEVHALSSGLKALCTTIATDGMEECRRVMGGHGYSQASGIPHMYATQAAQVTYEGENYLLTQQTTRYLLKLAAQVQRTGELEASLITQYISRLPHLAGDRCDPATTQQDWQTRGELIVAAMAHRAAVILAAAARDVQHKPWHAMNITCYRLSNAHCMHALVATYFKWVADLKADQDISTPRPLLDALYRQGLIFGLFQMQQQLGDFLEDGYLAGAQGRHIRAALEALLETNAPDAVGLVDAWDHSDYFLNSYLGNYDGGAYKNMWDWAQNEPLNVIVRETGVPPGYAAHIRPIVQGQLPHQDQSLQIPARL